VPPRKRKPDALARKRREIADVVPPLTDADRELLALAAQVQQYAESARNLVLRADTQAHVARFGTVEAFKSQELQRMRRMLRAWRGLKDEDGAPYRDARMLLTGWVLFYAGVIRNGGELERRGVFARTSPEANEAQLRAKAEQVAGIVAQHYPELAAKMAEPDRIERIRRAIASSATSAKKKPLKLLAATWDGIEKRPRNPARWGVDWNEHEARNLTRRT
jgi:hypothetical protein